MMMVDDGIQRRSRSKVFCMMIVDAAEVGGGG